MISAGLGVTGGGIRGSRCASARPAADRTVDGTGFLPALFQKVLQNIRRQDRRRGEACRSRGDRARTASAPVEKPTAARATSPANFVGNMMQLRLWERRFLIHEREARAFCASELCWISHDLGFAMFPCGRRVTPSSLKDDRARLSISARQATSRGWWLRSSVAGAMIRTPSARYVSQIDPPRSIARRTTLKGRTGLCSRRAKKSPLSLQALAGWRWICRADIACSSRELSYPRCAAKTVRWLTSADVRAYAP
jgi:hypothetical protein